MSHCHHQSLTDHLWKGGRKIVRARGSGCPQWNSTCLTYCTHGLTAAVTCTRKTSTRSSQPKPQHEGGWLVKVQPQLMNYWWLMLLGGCGSQFSSGIQPFGGYPCRSRWSYTHAHTGSTGWTQWGFLFLNKTWSWEGKMIGRQERNWKRGNQGIRVDLIKTHHVHYDIHKQWKK